MTSLIILAYTLCDFLICVLSLFSLYAPQCRGLLPRFHTEGGGGADALGFPPPPEF